MSKVRPEPRNWRTVTLTLEYTRNVLSASDEEAVVRASELAKGAVLHATVEEMQLICPWCNHDSTGTSNFQQSDADMHFSHTLTCAEKKRLEKKVKKVKSITVSSLTK